MPQVKATTEGQRASAAAPRVSGLLTVRLSLRLLAPRGSSEWIAGWAMIVTTALTLVSALLVSSMLSAFAHRQDVLLAREPALSHGSSTALAAYEVEDVGGSELVLLQVGGDLAGVAPPPGVERLPAPGEVLVSPAARSLIGTNPYAAALVPGQVTGTIGAQALRDPGEAFVIMGTTLETIKKSGMAQPIQGFGSSRTSVEDLTGGQLQLAGLLVSVVLGGAAIVLFGTLARLSGRSRDRRIAVLLLLGTPSAVVRRTAAVQTGVLAAVGCLVGALLSAPARQALAHIGVLGVRWWPDTATVPAPLVLTLCVAFVLLAARLSARAVVSDPWAVRRDIPIRGGSLLRITPLVLGAAMLVGLVIAEIGNARTGRGLSGGAVVALLGAVVMVMVGVVIAGEDLIKAACASPSKGGRLTTRLAAARAGHHARSVARISAALMILMLLSGMVLGVFQATSQQASPDGRDRLSLEVHAVPGLALRTEALQAVLTDPQVISVLVERGPDSGRPSLEWMHSAAEARPDDASYSITLPPDEARRWAARLITASPALQDLFDRDLAGPRDGVMENAAVLLALLLATVVVLIAVGVALVTLQQDRREPDGALLMAGLPRRALVHVRALEVLLGIGPGVVVASLLALAVAVTVTRIDTPGNPAPVRGWLVLSAIGATVVALLAIAAGGATPRRQDVSVRRD